MPSATENGNCTFTLKSITVFFSTLEADPHETTDLLLRDPAHQSQVIRMSKLMETHRKKLGDPYPSEALRILHQKNPITRTINAPLTDGNRSGFETNISSGRNDPNHGIRKTN